MAVLHKQNLRCYMHSLLAADRDMLKLTQQEFETVPLIIKVEVLIAAVTCMWGKTSAHAKFGASTGT